MNQQTAGARVRDPLSIVLRGLIRGYQLLFSPLVPAHTCRFLPTCSAYGLEAIDRHGAMVGSWLTIRRLLRCHPWGGSGFDPVPPPRTKNNREASCPHASLEERRPIRKDAK